jgi:hypothetical protein
MKSNRIFANIYNDSPTQHTDLFIGVFQLLFWLILRPSAWDNHIQQLDPHLQKSFFLTSWIRQRGLYRSCYAKILLNLVFIA